MTFIHIIRVICDKQKVSKIISVNVNRMLSMRLFNETFRHRNNNFHSWMSKSKNDVNLTRIHRVWGHCFLYYKKHDQYRTRCPLSIYNYKTIEVDNMVFNLNLKLKIQTMTRILEDFQEQTEVM
jgi:hypothetical protein